MPQGARRPDFRGTKPGRGHAGGLEASDHVPTRHLKTATRPRLRDPAVAAAAGGSGRSSHRPTRVRQHCRPQPPRRAGHRRDAEGGKVYRVGWLANTPWPPNDPVREAFAQAMRQKGWVEGQNVIFDRRYSEGRSDRHPALAAELVRLQPDLIITAGTAATVAAKAATATIPIVFIAVGDPVGSGLVASLARPGGNVTGQGGLGPEMHVKMLELLKEAVPKASRMAVFVNSGFPLHAVYRKAIESVALSLNVALKPFEVRAPEELDGAFATVAREKLDALIVLGQPMMFVHRARVATLALEHQMPAIIVWGEAVEAGVLMSYGARSIDELRRLPYYIDRILKGAKPADLPVEQYTTFYLSINLKTAKALGLTIPPDAAAAGGPGHRVASAPVPPIWRDSSGRPILTRPCPRCATEVPIRNPSTPLPCRRSVGAQPAARRE